MQRLRSFKQNNLCALSVDSGKQWWLQLVSTSAMWRGFLPFSPWKGILLTGLVEEVCEMFCVWWIRSGTLLDILYPSPPFTWNIQQEKEKKIPPIHFSDYRSAGGCGLLLLLLEWGFQSSRRRAKTWCSEPVSTPLQGFSTQALFMAFLLGIMSAQKSVKKKIMDWGGIWQDTITEVVQG